MRSEFDRDLEAVRRECGLDRETLLSVVAALSDADLDRARRGGWTVRRVLEHVIRSEWLYITLVNHLRGQQPANTPMEAGPPESVAEASRDLEASRQALLAAIEGVDEETFYQLERVGHEEYSVISVLENVALHDREHAAQVEAIMELVDTHP